MSETFKLGDVISLRSGDRAMTVTGIDSDMFVQCEWIDERGAHIHRAFPATALAHCIRLPVSHYDGTYRYVWCFAGTGTPIADHIAMVGATP